MIVETVEPYSDTEGEFVPATQPQIKNPVTLNHNDAHHPARPGVSRVPISILSA